MKDSMLAAHGSADNASVWLYVSGEWRAVDAELWRKLSGSDRVPPRFISDGCTASPDYMFGHDIWPACVVHDFDYSEDSDETSRLRADLRLGKNVYKCRRHQGANFLRAAFNAASYTKAVRRVGAFFFKRGPGSYTDEDPPND